MSYSKWNIWTLCKNSNVTMCKNSKGSQNEISIEVNETEHRSYAGIRAGQPKPRN
jgi:hypothetical protein